MKKMNLRLKQIEKKFGRKPRYEWVEYTEEYIAGICRFRSNPKDLREELLSKGGRWLEISTAEEEAESERMFQEHLKKFPGVQRKYDLQSKK